MGLKCSSIIIHSPSDLSPISSDPYQVCFCSNNNSWLECSIRSIERHTYPGEQFSFYALTAGQCNGSAPHTILANLQIRDSETDSHLDPLESSLPSFQGDLQCAYHRAGILCGECKNGYSLILGNSECRKCSTQTYLCCWCSL